MNRLYPVFSLEKAKAFERSILKDDPEMTSRAMEQAGRAIGEALFQDYQEIRRWPDHPEMLVLAGKGLNTGDALIACETLLAKLPDLRVRLVTTIPEEDWNPLSAAVLHRLRPLMGSSLSIVPASGFLEEENQAYAVVLDGLYGLGFRPPLRESAAALLKRVNENDRIELRAAVDAPSGVGESADPGSFVADFTYMPGVAKAPCFVPAHVSFVGRIRFLEIDSFLSQPSPPGQRDFVASPFYFKSLNRLRSGQSDKRTYGHGLILAGSPRMPGAAVMATLGALQSGAGLVTTLTAANVSTHLAGVVPEAMWRPLQLTNEGGIDVEVVRVLGQLADQAHAVLIGPGLVMDRATTFAICRIIRETPLPLVLDASALTQDVIAAVLGRPLKAGSVVITPHRGEYARMLGPKEDPQDLQALIGFSRRYRVTTLLKGSPTLVCDGERVIYLAVGGPVLARGGAGDILAGMLLTQLAQHPEKPLEATLHAATWHGAAADALARDQGAVAVRTTDLLACLAPSLRS